MFHYCERQSHKTVSAATTTFEEKGELKRIRTEVPPFISLMPYCLAKPAHKIQVVPLVEFMYLVFTRMSGELL